MRWFYGAKGLCVSFRLDQLVVCDVFAGDGDAEQGAEGGVSGAPAVEAEDELVEVGSQVLATQPMVDAPQISPIWTHFCGQE